MFQVSASCWRLLISLRQLTPPAAAPLIAIVEPFPCRLTNLGSAETVETAARRVTSVVIPYMVDEAGRCDIELVY